MPKLKQFNGSEWVEIGQNGKSAYELWIDAGNTGTQQEFLRALKGDRGPAGKDGKTPQLGKDFWTEKDAKEWIQKLDDEMRPEMVKAARASVSSKTYSVGELENMRSATTGQVPTKQSDGTWAPSTPAGSGDMTKAVYDTNDDGVVDEAAAIEGVGSAGNSKYYGTNGSGTPGFFTLAATVTALSDVGDVTITSIASGELLKWNGSAWINNTLAEAGIAAASHNHAASDITSGTLTHERGGLEADVSAYSGLIKIAAGSTSQAVADTDYQSVPAEGAFANGDKTKLDGIEASADVTDATNVAAAGAVMADGTGNDITGDIVFTEKADHSSTPGAGKGYLWVKNTAPSTLIFTDDAGTDTTLGSGGAGDSVSIDGVGVTDPDFVSTGDIDFVDTSNTITANINSGAVDIAHLSATGTPSSSTFLRGDNTWATPAGSGDVSKVGTPVDHQVGVWTGDGTIEGSSEFLYYDSTDSGYSAPQIFLGQNDINVGVHLNSQSDGSGAGALFSRHQNSTGAPAFYIYKSRGTGATPTAILSGDSLGAFYFAGHDGTAYETTAAITVAATENFGASNEGTAVKFNATANGATASSTYITLGGANDVDLAASTSLSWAGTDILSDNAGTMTLSNVDALDATTEATIEAAIDTLSNLTTVGTLTSGNADAIVSAASTTTAGKVELATTAETDTGTDTGRAITPDGLAGSYAGTKSVGIQVTDGSGAITTGDGKAYIRIPTSLNGMNLVAVAASLTAPSTSGTPTIQIARGRQAAPGTAHAFVDMLSTAVTIDQDEYDSKDATTAAVINGSNDDVATGDLIRVDVDGVGSGPTAVLSVNLEFRLP